VLNSAAASKPKATLDRALSRLGVLSRTQAQSAIVAGRVGVNARIVIDPARWVDLTKDRITLDGRVLAAAAPLYLMLNKPRGMVVTRSDERARPTVYAQLGEWEQSGVMPLGRLDQASEGLLLFSNDTHWAARITDPSNALIKRYHVQISGHLDAAAMVTLRAGVDDPEVGRLDTHSVFALRAGEKNQWLEFALLEGKNRHIRRALQHVGFEVLRLIRVAIGPLELGDLARGQVRPLAASEVQALAAAPPATPAQNARYPARASEP
jgi:23S rRNA pseudouridine2605 synthase